MQIKDLLMDNAWKSTQRGFRFERSTGVVWRDVEKTTRGRIRITRPVQGSSWGKRIIQRYVNETQAVVLVPLKV